MEEYLGQIDELDAQSAPQQEELTERVCKILVIGVGGAGNNAVNRMIRSGIDSAEFVAANTDKQDLIYCEAKKKVVLGATLTRGLGAGSNPNIGKKAAEETKEVIKELLQGVDLLFITAGMGGGTGTGAAPVIASIAHDLGILTIAVVTTPFKFEGERRMSQAMSGINELRQYVDTLLVIPNEKLLEVLPKGTSFSQAFSFADDVLRQGIQGIAGLIVKNSIINRDFADVKTVLKEKGFAHIGIGEAEGENRTVEAVRQAVNNRLLDTNIREASAAILFITGGMDLSLTEINEAGSLVAQVLNPDATLIFGADMSQDLGGKVSVTIIATGFKHGSDPVLPRFMAQRPSSQPAMNVPLRDHISPAAELPPMPERRPHSDEPAPSQSQDDFGGRIPLSDNDLPPFMRKLKRR
ncbi:MAG TPA: cell division protein FtsZ [Clostridiales bacterium]|nr:cell division protein FtsZ [Clostridiales bacterium]